MEAKENMNVEMNYTQLLHRQLDRVAAASSKDFNVPKMKMDTMEWQIKVLGAFIPDELVDAEDRAKLEKKKENGEDSDRKEIIVNRLHTIINILAKHGKLYEHSKSGSVPKQKKKTGVEIWD